MLVKMSEKSLPSAPATVQTLSMVEVTKTSEGAEQPIKEVTPSFERLVKTEFGPYSPVLAWKFCFGPGVTKIGIPVKAAFSEDISRVRALFVESITADFIFTSVGSTLALGMPMYTTHLSQPSLSDIVSCPNYHVKTSGVNAMAVDALDVRIPASMSNQLWPPPLANKELVIYLYANVLAGEAYVKLFMPFSKFGYEYTEKTTDLKEHAIKTDKEVELDGEFIPVPGVNELFFAAKSAQTFGQLPFNKMFLTSDAPGRYWHKTVNGEFFWYKKDGWIKYEDDDLAIFFSGREEPFCWRGNAPEE